MKAHKNRSALDWVALIFEGGIRAMVGCFITGIVAIIAVVFLSSHHFNPLHGRLPTVGPRVPIPSVEAVTLLAGERVYQREDCSACHTLSGADPKDARYGKSESRTAPDLTQEGERNASIDWQIANLQDHHRLYPNSMMPDYDDLPESELRALASFMATRK